MSDPKKDETDEELEKVLAEAEAGGPPSEPDEGVLIDDVDLKDALRGALRPPPGAVAPSLLRGVQKKLRVRSKGKFYGDGWSTAQSPRSTYLITSLLMLLLIAIVLFALLPNSFSSLP